MNSTVMRPKATRNAKSSASRAKICARDEDCSCFSGGRRPVPLHRNPAQPLLHMDDCDDPNCSSLEQLKELQQSLDRFTDYDHYERCCDGHHGHHRGQHRHNSCCDDDQDVCPTQDDVCSEADCGNSSDDCDECAEEHADCYEEVVVCEDDCEQCEVECEVRGHDIDECPQNHATTRDNCITSYDVPLPLLGPTNDFDMNGLGLTGVSSMIPDLLPTVMPCTDDCSVPPPLPNSFPQPYIPESVFDTAMDHWQTFIRKHHCAPDPCLVGQESISGPPQHVDPAFGFTFGCDPSLPSNQYPWQQNISQCAVPFNPTVQINQDAMVIDVKSYDTIRTPPTPPSQSTQTSPLTSTPDTPTPDRVCQWLMPCGSICGATYTRTDDLKKHVKNSHGLKGTTTCRWQSCTSSFATEAALTGHISKKHLSFNDEEGPWKCTFANCTKSFMYKQVRDEHVASHNGGNRMHCPICHQWLNAEGSNFRRHMASHGPKHEHMKCRFEGLGCRRRFPRLDNLRRHEACCKFGKRAAGVHHHHHRVHVGHTM